MGVITDLIGGWRRVDLGGVTMKVLRDDVTRTSAYRHPRDPDSLTSRGMFPRVIREDGRPPLVECTLISGNLKRYSGYESSVINADGRVMQWRGQPRTHVTNDKTSYVPVIRCDDEWISFLGAVSRANIVVWRIKFAAWRTRFFYQEPSLKDFEITTWNKLLVGEVLQAYSTLLAQAKDPVKLLVSTDSPRPTPTEPSDGAKVRYGPFDFYPDGTVTDVEGGLRLTPGIQFGELNIRGFSLKRSSGRGYIVGHPSGTKVEFDYGTGRIRRRTVNPERSDS